MPPLPPFAAGFFGNAPTAPKIPPLSKTRTLLTLHQASVVAGEAVRADSSPSEGTCIFRGSGRASVLTLTGYLQPDVQSAKRYIAQLEMTPGQSLQAVSGIGDHAAFILTPTGETRLILRKEEKLLLISLTYPTPPGAATQKLSLLHAGKMAIAHL